MFEENWRPILLLSSAFAGLGGNFIWIASSPDLLHWGQSPLHSTYPKRDVGTVQGRGWLFPDQNTGRLASLFIMNADHEDRYCRGSSFDLNDPGLKCWLVLKPYF
ncbi:MAG: hypothetical protein R2788_09805 [Saprospiraceae bacterium]